MRASVCVHSSARACIFLLRVPLLPLPPQGPVAGDDAVLGFLVPPTPGAGGAPLKSLVGFERVHLGPGDSITLIFPVSGHDLSLVRGDGSRSPRGGDWAFVVGPGAGGAAVPLSVV